MSDKMITNSTDTEELRRQGLAKLGQLEQAIEAEEKNYNSVRDEAAAALEERVRQMIAHQKQWRTLHNERRKLQEDLGMAPRLYPDRPIFEKRLLLGESLNSALHAVQNQVETQDRQNATRVGTGLRGS